MSSIRLKPDRGKDRLISRKLSFWGEATDWGGGECNCVISYCPWACELNTTLPQKGRRCRACIGRVTDSGPCAQAMRSPSQFDREGGRDWE